MTVVPITMPPTSAAGPMGGALNATFVALLLGSLSTTAARPPAMRRLEPASVSTTAGTPVSPPCGAAAAIGEVRRLTGLTWDQLARLFEVSRRTMHFWASGKPLAAGHEERLHRVLVSVRRLDRGSAAENRSLLLAAQPNGDTLFDLLSQGRHEDVLRLAGTATTPARPRAPQLSDAEQAARRPSPPSTLVGALQDRVHSERARTLARKPIRLSREK